MVGVDGGARVVRRAGFWLGLVLAVLAAGAALSSRSAGATGDYDPDYPPADIQVNYRFERAPGRTGTWDLTVRWQGNPRQLGPGRYDWYPAFDTLARPGTFTVSGSTHEVYRIGGTRYEERGTWHFDTDDSRFIRRPDRVTIYTNGEGDPWPAFLQLYVPLVVRGTVTVTRPDGSSFEEEFETRHGFRISTEDHPGITGEFSEVGADRVSVQFSGTDRMVDDSEQTHTWQVTGGLGDFEPPGIQLQVFDANIRHTSGIPIPLQSPAHRETLATHGWQSAAREAFRASADGVTLLLLRARLSGGEGPVTFRVERHAGEGPLGSLWSVDDPSLLDATAEGGGRDRLDGGGPPGEGPEELVVPRTEIGEEEWAFALYRTPRNFDPPDAPGEGGLRERTVRIRASSPGAGGPVEADQVITLVRPLVVFVHGTWDRPATWENFPLFQGSLKVVDPAAASIRTAPEAPFYAGRISFWEVFHASGSLPQNAAWLMPQLTRLIEAWKETAQLAATQVDVVTHSYGGTSMRFLAQTQRDSNPLTRDSQSFRRLENWGHGYVHKLITLAATHRGSALANHAAKINLLSRGRLNEFFRSQNHDIDQGAAEDQFVLSEAIRSLRQTRVPGHAFVGSGDLEHSGPKLPFEVVPFLLGYFFDRDGGPYRRGGPPTDFAALRRLSNYIFNLDYARRGDELGEPNYDLTVSAVSSRGGMPSGAYSTVRELGVSGLEGRVSHLNQTDNEHVSRRVEFLLKQQIGSPYFAYFPPPAAAGLTDAEAGLSQRAQFDPAWLRLTSTAPAASSGVAARRPARTQPSLSVDDADGLVAPGDTLQVTLAWPGEQVRSAVVAWPTGSRGGGVQILSADQLSFALTVPPLDPGPFPVSALFFTAAGKTEVRSATLEVAASDVYENLRVEPPRLVLASTDLASARVYGQLPGGAWQDVTESSRTALSSSNPAVAVVTPERLLAPRDFGEASLHVSVQGGGQLTVPVSVEGTAVEVRSLVRRLQLRSARPAGFAFLSGTGFDARTLVPRTIRVSGLRPLSARIRDVNRDGRPDLVASVRPRDLRGLAPGTVTVHLLGATEGGTLVGGGARVTAR